MGFTCESGSLEEYVQYLGRFVSSSRGSKSISKVSIQRRFTASSVHYIYTCY